MISSFRGLQLNRTGNWREMLKHIKERHPQYIRNFHCRHPSPTTSFVRSWAYHSLTNGNCPVAEGLPGSPCTMARSYHNSGILMLPPYPIGRALSSSSSASHSAPLEIPWVVELTQQSSSRHAGGCSRLWREKLHPG